ncbi:MAG: protein-tyrosine-phosphatase [Balneolaceae bacterium]|nr:MAG: protein-tyrosine-phosphatase [Balneolaceae bacterium]
MVSNWLNSIKENLEKNPTDRHQEHIVSLSNWIAEETNRGNRANLNFICTHNSRRSQFAQTWCHVVQKWYGIDVANSYSGGTEVTACNERTIAALKRTGLSVGSDGAENPVYSITDSELDLNLRLWSKVYDDPSNSAERFAAVMTCDHADQNCPFIPGAAIRIPLTYTDPKYADDTEEEETAYDQTCTIIATDMIRIFSLLRKNLS